ncbi:EAL domain-containing protein [Arsenicitalea aurantiaca]|uniref:EAL domain-containing protein n=1 Tax=Arsenicitalea aurantiaca TaxID=1783274 RepID=A0A433XAW8_9HYPH|nr:EAL domain-containing protein [Arsenicitalea aurantiaca]RUT31202.1 EAL domain-containing protein [Arsenicitalea aurantiaca]
MQALVYIFIACAALGIGVAAYFGLTFTPIEAGVTALVFGCMAVVLMERVLRRRAEARLEKAISDLSRLLSTDAQAGSVLSQRINALVDVNAGSRLESVEADISVLGTVVRQVAETLAEIEDTRRSTPATVPAAVVNTAPATEVDTFPEPVIPLSMLRQALEEQRMVCHIEPIIQLPKRRPHGYDLVPRIGLEDGEFADRPDFMPRRGGEEVVRRIEAFCLEEAIVIARRARTAGQPIILYVPLSRASLSDPDTRTTIEAAIEANRAIAGSLLFAMGEADCRLLSNAEKALLTNLAHLGVGLSLAGATSLRVDFADLAGMGFRNIRIDATGFLTRPQSFTDFHTADIADYAKRFGLDLVGTGVIDEQQLLGLFEDGIVFAQGPHIGGPGPVRSDLMAERKSVRVEIPRRAEA